MSWTALKKFVVLCTQELRIGKKTFIPLRVECVAGFVGVPSTPFVMFVLFCAVLPSVPSCKMARDGADGEHSDTTAPCDRNVSFQPARNIPSFCWCLPPVPPVSTKQGDRNCYFLFRQNIYTNGNTNTSRKHQKKQEEAIAASKQQATSSQQQAEQ